eukprot:GFYU01003438.1.p1 GENE.GFYU01003438.1~~GFYU01003438.1.p1  ORF type:complete len:595 (+),score=132.55 GFYU01003438.1:62-1846(+)
MALVGMEIHAKRGSRGLKDTVFSVDRKLDNGAFGTVYAGTNKSSGQPVAIKVEGESEVEKPRIYSPEDPPFEWQVYEAVGGLPGFPALHYTGFEGVLAVMVIDLLGHSLRDLMVKCDGRFTAEVTATIAYQLVGNMEHLHNKGFVHGDVKPENIMAGLPGTPNDKLLYFVDLGLASRWKSTYGTHNCYHQRIGRFNGTRRYASIHAHLGRAPARRDDLESLGYVLIYFLRGRLPWQGYGDGDEARDEVGRLKRVLSAEELAKGFPDCFAKYIEYVRNLKFEDIPDYEKMKSFFLEMKVDDLVFDVNLPKRMLEEVELVQQRPLTRGRKRSGPDDSQQMQPVKRQRVLPAVHKIIPPYEHLQWILVFTSSRRVIQQWYTCNRCYEDMKEYIKARWNEGASVTQICLAFDMWSAVLTSGRSATESMKVSTRFLPNDWIQRKWEEGFFITVVAGKPGNSVVVMAQGTSYYLQDLIVSDTFPVKWVNQKWREGYFITSMATSANQWAVIMSKGANFHRQKLEMDYKYPSESIRGLWREGYRVTAAAATNEMMVFCLSYHPDTCDLQEQTHRTPRQPREAIEKAWKQDLYVSWMTAGKP